MYVGTPLRDPSLTQNSLDENEEDTEANEEINEEGFDARIIQGFVEEGIIDLLLLTLSNVNNINAEHEYTYIEDDQIYFEIQ